uniref:Uncharacterized protein n=1 Tax=Manihot esculenta TaxID=3983 RepID=A0A2C9UD91_MANES
MSFKSSSLICSLSIYCRHKTKMRKKAHCSGIYNELENCSKHIQLILTLFYVHREEILHKSCKNNLSVTRIFKHMYNILDLIQKSEDGLSLQSLLFSN